MSDWSTSFIQDVLLEEIINQGVKP
jgi:hypothetical protein